MLEIGQIVRNRYRITRLLGRGGMADVYLAGDTLRQANVALKVLREDLAEEAEFRRRFAREAEAVAKLEHPNIVRFYSFETDGPLAVIVMDYVPGERTLRTRLLESGGGLPVAEAGEVLHQAGSALQYAHRQGFVHRDIKPANIMLKPDGTVLLADFGIARAMEATTATQGLLGTPAYMSPEQVLGRELDLRSDVYSFGVVLFEMVTGRRPFNGDTGTGTTTARRIQDEHLHAPPPDASEVNAATPAAVAAVLRRALAKSPADRWADVSSLVAAWDSAAASVVRPAPDMARCAYCGVTNRRSARFCARCGRPTGGRAAPAGPGAVGPVAGDRTPPSPVSGQAQQGQAAGPAPRATVSPAGARPRIATTVPPTLVVAGRAPLPPGVPSPNGRRLLAWLIDSVLATVVWFGTAMVLTLFLSLLGVRTVDSEGQATSTPMLLAFLGVAGYFVLSWGRAGTTPGRALLKQRLVTADGGKPGVTRASLRYLVMLLLTPLLGLAWWPVLWRPDRRGLHDLVAGTWPVGRGG